MSPRIERWFHLTKRPCSLVRYQSQFGVAKIIVFQIARPTCDRFACLHKYYLCFFGHIVMPNLRSIKDLSTLKNYKVLKNGKHIVSLIVYYP